MSFTDIKTKNQGFTIVELLIVVVVIAILAAITIVSYNGITNKANASSAKSTASTVQKKIELYNSEKGRYPIAASELTTANESFTLDAATFGSGAPTAAKPSTGTDTKGTGYVQVRACKNSTAAPSATNITGIKITYWDYEKTASQATDIDLGTNCGTAANVSALN